MIVTATDVRKAVEARLRTALPAALTKLSTTDLPLTAPKTWRRLPDFIQITEQQSPAVVVTSPGIDGEPATYADGSSDMTWLVRVFCVIRGANYNETADRVGVYTAAVRAALLGDPSLGGLASGVEQRDEKYSELDTDKARTVGAGSVLVAFSVTTDLDLPEVPVTSTALTTDMLPAL